MRYTLWNVSIEMLEPTTAILYKVGECVAVLLSGDHVLGESHTAGILEVTNRQIEALPVAGLQVQGITEELVSHRQPFQKESQPDPIFNSRLLPIRRFERAMSYGVAHLEATK